MTANTTWAVMLTITSRAVAAILGAFLAYLSPTFPFILLCFLFIVFDCFTAWRLSKRVHEKYPDSSDGKFKSSHASKIIMTFMKVLMCIFLAYFADKILFPGVDAHLPNIAAGAFCFTQFISILENESSVNDSKWARLLQKILVDKAERHLNTNLDEFRPKDEKQKINEQES